MSAIAGPIVDTGDRLAKRNALVLAAAQALAGGNSIVIVSTAGIVGSSLVGKALATVPVSTYVLGMWMATLPVGAIAKRFGEDPKDVEKMKRDPGGAFESMQDAMLPVLEDIGSEIRLSFDYHENQYDQEVKEVYISGGTVLFPGIDNMLAQIFNLPIKAWDPTEGLELTGPGAGAGANSDMAIAMGLASRLRNM